MKTETYEIGVDRVLKFNKKKEEISIIDKKTGKEAVFTATRWASFRQCMMMMMMMMMKRGFI